MKRLPLIGLVAGGAFLLAVGLGALVVYERTPAVLLQHADPHKTQIQAGTPLQRLEKGLAALANPSAIPNPVGLLAVSPYAQAVKPLPAPVTVAHTEKRKGLWLEIPSLQITLPVNNGDGSNKIPQWQALRFPGTPAPGASGNSWLYAHGLWGMFGGLLYARVGDKVVLHNYTTGSVKTLHINKVVGLVHFNDMKWVRMQSSAPMLTLTTCLDYNPKGDRFVVQAK